MSIGEYGRLLGPAGPLAREIEGFEPRREQQVMADHVGEALERHGFLAVEAGTGTGKTFAYLVPALLSGRHVILSTGTRTLQDQLFHRDLPRVSAALGRPVKVALLKGRSNYLCRHRLTLATQTPDLPGLEAPSQRSLEKVRRWSERTRSGDLAELEGLKDNDPVFAAVTSTRDNCLGAACAEFNRCHVVLARREAQAADIVVVNHHLLLADLALKEEGFGELLPGTEAVILDEAHQVPETAAQFFGASASSRQGVSLARDALAEFTRAGVINPLIREQLFGLEQSFAAAHATLRGLPERIDWPALPDAFLEAFEAAAGALEVLAQGLEDGGFEEAGIVAIGRRATALATQVRDVLARPPEDGLKWVEWTARAFTAHFTPFEVADRLREFMTARPCAWIFTSATLAVGDDFRHFTSRIGAADATTLRIDSPFDYESQALVYLPRELPDPADRSYTAALVDDTWPLVQAAGGRTFLLFTSHRALGEAARLLRGTGRDRDYPLLVQGEAPRERLLAQFRELGNAVLLGTSSFWEGVDVRGHALALVVIDKLPFASPDDPMLKARIEGIKRRGGNPFNEFQLPQAVLALKQGFGRLIRDREDFGVVALCDPRLTSRGYGRLFLQSLPPAARTRDRDEAARFLARRLALAGLAPAQQAHG